MAHLSLGDGLHLALYSVQGDTNGDASEPASDYAVPPQTDAQTGVAGGPDVDAWAIGVLKSLGMTNATGTGGAPLAIHLDALPHRPAKVAGAAAAAGSKVAFGPDHPAGNYRAAAPQRTPSRRDSQRHREAVLKGKEGSRQRRRWENDRLMHVPNAQPPLPSDWEVRPTHPVHYGLPYHMAQYWDKGLRQQVNETRAAAAVQRRRQMVAQQAGMPGDKTGGKTTGKTADKERACVGMVTRELRATAKKTPAVKTWVRVLEEPVRAYLVAVAAARAAGCPPDGRPSSSGTDRSWTSGEDNDPEPPCFSDEDEDEIVFVGRNGRRPQTPVDGGIVIDALGDDRDGSFKRWLTHSISDYYGLASHSVSVDSPPRRIVYVTLHEEMRAADGPEFLVPRPMWELF